MMASIITSRAKHLLILPLNSGETVHLAPGESSGPIEDYQLDHNEKIKKLLRVNLIGSRPVEASAETPAVAQEKKRVGTRPSTRIND